MNADAATGAIAPPKTSEIPETLEQLNQARWRLSAVLTTGVLVAYFGFILLVAFNRPLMGQELTDGLSIGIVLGAAVILVSFVLTAIYVSWANGRYDRGLHHIRNERRP